MSSYINKEEIITYGKWDDWDPIAPLSWEGENWIDCYPANSLSSE